MVRLPRRAELPSLLQGAGSRALHFAYPERCVHCGRFGASLCELCRSVLCAYESPARCAFCEALWPGPDNCPRCFGWDALDGATAPFEYEGIPRAMVRALKYGHTRSVAALMAEYLQPHIAHSGFAVPVPLHGRRHRQRGFNHAALMLEHLDHVPLSSGALLRRRRTHAQFGLSSRERSANVSGAFHYDGPTLEGQHITLLDDVVTTGATANECARVLRDAGAASVRVLAFTRASYQPAQSNETPVDT